MMDDSSSIGLKLKAKGEVIKQQNEVYGRPPNMNCRIETFSRICQTFDERRTRWVNEMGFGGLLNIASDIHLPRQLGYWLMTRIDPYKKLMCTSDGKMLWLSPNQVHWVLGIPNGGIAVPKGKWSVKELKEKLHFFYDNYGKLSRTKSRKNPSEEYTSASIPVNCKMMERVEGDWSDHEGLEFKTLFLLLSLELILCPTQAPRLARDLFPALSCAADAYMYNWCDLVLDRLMESVISFGRRFYQQGVAGGCGGCTIFAVVFYLDRLNRYPVEWGVFPRLKVWSINKIRLASKEDRLKEGGDYGLLGTMDVAYGEPHPLEARDTYGPCKFEEEVFHVPEQFRSSACASSKRKKRRQGVGNKFPKCSKKVIVPTSSDQPVHIAKHSRGSLIGGDVYITTVEVVERIMAWFNRLYLKQKQEPIWNTLKVDSSVTVEVVVCEGGSLVLGLLQKSLNNFVLNKRSQYFALVSEVFPPGLHVQTIVKSTRWLVAKKDCETELCLIRLRQDMSSFDGVGVENWMHGNCGQLVCNLYHTWFMHLPRSCVLRNVVMIQE